MGFNLDSHKLHYHPKRVCSFLETGDTYPIYMEVSPVGSCNHRCTFCAYDYIGYPNRKLDKKHFLRFIDEVASKGLKSMLYAGEGEPLMHPDIGEFIVATKSKGIDVGLFTNGELLEKRLNETILEKLTFIRFSINGGDSQTYKEIHKKDSFDKILNNLEYCAKLKQRYSLNVTIGVQFVLLPENIDSIESLIVQIQNFGIDYISIKPFVLQSKNQLYRQKSFDRDLKPFFRKLQNYSTDSFSVIARENAFEKYGQRDYEHCYGCNFITVLNSAGEIASCLPYWDKEEFVYGNIYEETFELIWNGEKRKKIKYYLENEIDVKQCPPNCRPHAINSFLEEIKHPNIQHINFI